MVVFLQSGCIRAKAVVFWQKQLHSGKVVVFGQTWLSSCKVVVFGQSGCFFLAKLVLFWRKLIVFDQECLF